MRPRAFEYIPVFQTNERWGGTRILRVVFTGGTPVPLCKLNHYPAVTGRIFTG